MKQEIIALQKLFSSIGSLNEVEKIMAYATAKTLVDYIDESLEDHQVAGRSYASEKLLQALSHFRDAALSGTDPAKAEESAHKATFGLNQFADNIPEEFRP